MSLAGERRDVRRHLFFRL